MSNDKYYTRRDLIELIGRRAMDRAFEVGYLTPIKFGENQNSGIKVLKSEYDLYERRMIMKSIKKWESAK